MPRRRLLVGLCGLATLAILLVGLIELASSPRTENSSKLAKLTPAQMQARLAGSPLALEKLHSQADLLLDGGTAVLQARLASLHGTPVVINKWASWCASCRSESPVFQHASVDLGRQVAFIGIDSGDSSRSDAQTFLRSQPASYPSFYDQSGHLGEAITGSSFWPVTVFYDRAGRQVYIRQGPYPSLAKLESDVKHYALED
jgi:cytochrome c biogenesis protein CcmG, thiol:disulfide interchange protein DsbE